MGPGAPTVSRRLVRPLAPKLRSVLRRRTDTREYPTVFGRRKGSFGACFTNSLGFSRGRIATRSMSICALSWPLCLDCVKSCYRICYPNSDTSSAGSVETYFAKAARGLSLTDRQWALVVGSVLGDASLPATTAGHCFRVHHGLAQRAFVDWKYTELRALVRTPPRQSGRAFYFRTVSHPAFGELASAAYDRGTKVVPLDFLARYFTALSLAVWIMDDGSIDGRQVRINTQSFKMSEVEQLRDFLFKHFALQTTINRDKGKPRLRVRAASIPHLTELIEPHILPEFRYKLPAKDSALKTLS